MKKIGRRARVILASSLAVVSLMGIGGSLAYMNATTDVVTNTFVASQALDDLTLDESALSESRDTDTGMITLNTEAARVTSNEYKGLMPGDVVPKDPTIVWDFPADDTNASHYVFVEVKDTLTTANQKDFNGTTGFAVTAKVATEAGSEYTWAPLVSASGAAVTGPNNVTDTTVVYVLCKDGQPAQVSDDGSAHVLDGDKFTVNGFYVDEQGSAILVDGLKQHVEEVVDAVEGSGVEMKFWGYACQTFGFGAPGTMDGAVAAFETVFASDTNYAYDWQAGQATA